MSAVEVLLHGTVVRPSGFTLLNRRYVDGLRRLGYRVTVLPNDGPPVESLPSGRPDVYLFHGDPFDFDRAPGRLNLFFLQWEYRHLKRAWVAALNARFDLVVVPSHATRAICEASGVTVPVRVVPGAFDAREFHPGAVPRELPTERGFRFLYLGGAHERRGLDVLLDAYLAEFSAADDVALLIKGFHYEHRRPWLRQVMRRAGAARQGAAEVVELHTLEDSVAGYFTACNVGVFPLRAECLGLPVLECLASGRPTIVTGGTALDEFCNVSNSEFVRASPRSRGGKWYLEPDRAHLRELMRAAYQRGAPSPADQARIATTVASFTWEASVACLSAAIEEGLRGVRIEPSPAVGGTTSSLAARPARTVSRGQDGLRPTGTVQTPRNDGDGARALKVVRAGPGPLEHLAATANQERERCGLERVAVRAIDAWIERLELKEADLLLVPGQAARSSFLAAGIAPTKLAVVPPVFPARGPAARRTGRVRFLFASDDPFRDGIRVLFESWNAARPNAELVCRVDRSTLQSRLLVKYLVLNPTIQIDTRAPRASRGLYDRVDCCVLPTLHDGYSAVVRGGIAAARPPIVSSASGLADIVLHGRNGWVVEPGSVDALAEALTLLADRVQLAALEPGTRALSLFWSRARFERARTVALRRSE